VIAGFRREDLFTVVHEIFLTDTADYADIVLSPPPVGALRRAQVLRPPVRARQQPGDRAAGEAKPNSEVFRLLAARMGFARPASAIRTKTSAARRAAVVESAHGRDRVGGAEGGRAGSGSMCPPRFAPFAEGNFHTPSGKCEFWSQTAMDMGLDPLPLNVAPRESALSAPQLAKKYPLAFISPPARNFLNSSFANLPFALKEAGEPYLDIHPPTQRRAA